MFDRDNWRSPNVRHQVDRSSLPTPRPSRPSRPCVSARFGVQQRRFTHSSMALAAGTRIGRYEIIDSLGAGGMGEVYRARDTRLERDVAIKILPASVAGDPERLARFDREAKAVAALSHPNILALHDAGTEDGVAFAVMELLDGETLRDRLAQGPLPVRRAIDITIQIARGLAAAHAKGLVHRDLKPENVFLVSDGQIKIL